LEKEHKAKERELLNSWKEIAAYLKREIRTCQRWEKELHLPVYRMDDSIRAKVFAYKDEISDWLKKRVKDNGIGKKSFFERKGYTAGIILGLSAVLVVLITFFLFFPHKRSSISLKFNPNHFLTAGNTLYIYDDNYEYLWEVKVETTRSLEKYYSFSTESNDPKKIDFADVDGDKKNEVLIFLPHESSNTRPIALFDNDGSLIWKREIELNQKYRDETLKNKPFHVHGLQFADILGDKNPEILVIWNHQTRFPGIFIIYDSNGNELLTYTNTGRLTECRVIKDEKNQKFIFLAGTNNLLNGDAVCIVLDCLHFKSGTGPPYRIHKDLLFYRDNIAKYIPVNPVSARQKYYMRIKHNELSLIYDREWIYPIFDSVGPGGIKFNIIFASPYSKLYFSFDSNLMLQNIIPNIEFEKAWNRYYREGKLSLPLEKLLSQAESSILFWDGLNWKPQLIQTH